LLFLIFASCVAFLFGIMFILFPKGLVEMTKWASMIASDIDEKALRYRIGLGICFLLLGAFFWFIVYYMKAILILEGLN